MALLVVDIKLCFEGFSYGQFINKNSFHAHLRYFVMSSTGG